MRDNDHILLERSPPYESSIFIVSNDPRFSHMAVFGLW
jgi:hypothetical protein